MGIDLRTKKLGGTWRHRSGDCGGFEVALNDESAHVTVTELGIMFEVDREDVPAAWEAKIVVDKLWFELVTTVVRRMSVEVLVELFREVSFQRQRALWDGEQKAKIKIREALGL
jgi:hypothetical protein